MRRSTRVLSTPDKEALMLLRFALATLLVALTAAPVSAQDYAEVKAKAT